MTRAQYHHLHRIARLGSLPVLAVYAGRSYYWFKREVYGIRGYGKFPRTFDPLGYGAKFRRTAERLAQWRASV